MNYINVYPIVEAYLDHKGHRTGEECLYVKIIWNDLIKDTEHEISFPLKEFAEVKDFMNPATFKKAMVRMASMYDFPAYALNLMNDFDYYKFSSVETPR